MCCIELLLRLHPLVCRLHVAPLLFSKATGKKYTQNDQTPCQPHFERKETSTSVLILVGCCSWWVTFSSLCVACPINVRKKCRVLY